MSWTQEISVSDDLAVLTAAAMLCGVVANVARRSDRVCSRARVPQRVVLALDHFTGDPVPGFT